MKTLLKDYPDEMVNVYLSYVNHLKTETKDGKLVNYWAKNISDQTYADLFKKVYASGLYIDGDSVTITWRKSPVITYDYHAYKNKVLKVYPETVFDFQLVYENDEYSFSKENGKVIYSHKIKEPFNNDKKIIGAYGIIKNKKGEFIEVLNTQDIDKMKKTSKMSYIWDAWYDRMVLKSIVKRICNIHFKDIVRDIDAQDNELNEPNRVLLNEQLLMDIDNAETKDQLDKIYTNNINKVENKEIFISALTNRKNEIKNK